MRGWAGGRFVSFTVLKPKVDSSAAVPVPLFDQACCKFLPCASCYLKQCAQLPLHVREWDGREQVHMLHSVEAEITWWISLEF